MFILRLPCAVDEMADFNFNELWTIFRIDPERFPYRKKFASFIGGLDRIVI